MPAQEWGRFEAAAAAEPAGTWFVKHDSHVASRLTRTAPAAALRAQGAAAAGDVVQKAVAGGLQLHGSRVDSIFWLLVTSFVPPPWLRS